MSYLPVIDAAGCICSGECQELCPSAFSVDDRDHAQVIGIAPDEQILAAAKECPTEAITVIDSKTGSQVYP